ncbi:hypothetical protein [Dactylosporangium sp. CA-233914]|uniref:hypothetical protein n=1 Tax=Dactylosporangium sp. CA-233914 TaxID=3239934 RepID=UPI003D903B27
MIEQRHLRTVDQHGATAPITLHIDAGTAQQTRITAVTAAETIGPVAGADLLEPLIEIRRRLEARGLRLCCQAARVNVWASGQLRQFTSGRQGYVLTETRRPSPEEPFEVVDFLAPAPAGQVTSLEEQYRFVYAFHGLQKPPK